jgi:hypothetical protein
MPPVYSTMIKVLLCLPLLPIIIPAVLVLAFMALVAVVFVAVATPFVSLCTGQSLWATFKQGIGSL